MVERPPERLLQFAHARQNGCFFEINSSPDRLDLSADNARRAAAAAEALAEAVRASGTCEGVRALAREETSRALASLEALPPSAARELLGGVARELASRAA